MPLRDAIAWSGGFRLSDGFISPLDLVEIGLMEAEEAKNLHAMAPALSARSSNYPIGMMTMHVGWVRVTPWTYKLI